MRFNQSLFVATVFLIMVSGKSYATDPCTTSQVNSVSSSLTMQANASAQCLENTGTITIPLVSQTQPHDNTGIYSGISFQNSTIINSGTINAGFGIVLEDVNGSIINSADSVINIIDPFGTGIGARIGSTNANIINAGDINATSGATGIYIEGGNSTVTNSGRIISTNPSGGVGIVNAAASTTIINTGIIDFSGAGNYGITNYTQWFVGTIATLTNSQGSLGGAPLTYTGALPANYKIVINSPTDYGQLRVLSSTYSGLYSIGTTSFGIYSGSIVANRTYAAVLSGVGASNLNALTGSYGSATWTLVPQATCTTNCVYDLIISGYYSGPSATDTQSSLQLLANKLKGVYALQTVSITNGLTYDCNVFDKEGICVSAGGRYDRVNTGNTNATNGLLIGSYKIDSNIRVGAWLDQNLSANSATGLDLNNGSPMFGVFGVWNGDKTGSGFKVRLSAGYGDKNLTATRQVVGTSEAGIGKTRLSTQGASGVVSYSLPLAKDLTISPFLGIRYTRVNANGYVESSTDITAPLTYSALKQEATTALAGLRFSVRMSSESGVFGSVGAELDARNKGNDYLVTGVDGLTNLTLNSNTKRLRGAASVGTYYDIEKTQRISLNAVYREEAFQRTNTLSMMAIYTAGL